MKLLGKMKGSGEGGKKFFSDSSCTCDITIDPDPKSTLKGGRKTGPLGKDKGGERAYIYTDEEDVYGSAVVSVKPGKKIDHQGIKVELIGQIDSGPTTTGHYDFFCISKDLQPPGSLSEGMTFQWEFKGVDKQCETYVGNNLKLRYFVRVSLVRGFGSNISKEVDFLVQNVTPTPETTTSIKMEVGIEDCLHIEFEFDKNSYHMKDVIVGKVYFLLVRIKIKHMELNINRTEVNGGATSEKQVSEKETVTKFEIMDGAPKKDECVPVRLYLSGCDLTPSYRNVQNKFSVKYFVSIVIVDEEDRRYFKQSEVTLYRKKIG